MCAYLPRLVCKGRFTQGPKFGGPLHAQAKSRDHEIVGAQNDTSKIM